MADPAPAPRLSDRLQAVVDALPLRPGLRVLEVGCGPGAAARAVADRVGPTGHVLAVDRSAKAIAQLTAGASELIEEGRLATRTCDAHDLRRASDEAPYDLAFAIRVGALDGRHPDLEARSIAAIASMLAPGAPLLIDGGDPLREIELPGHPR